MQSLRRNTNKTFNGEMVEMVSWEAGYRLEVPCMVRLYGPKAYIESHNKMKENIEV